MAKRNVPQLRYARVAAVAMVLVPLAGCLGIGEDNSLYWTNHDFVDEPVVGLVIKHEEGSASYGDDRFLADHLWRVCNASGTTLGDACREEVHPVTDDLPRIGETPPAVDVTAIVLSETSDELIVRIELAGLDPDWGHVDDKAEMFYSIDWAPKGQDEVWETAGFHIARHEDTLFFDSWYYSIHEECGIFWLCGARVPWEFEFGQPGAIVLIIPRGLMPHAEEGGALEINAMNVRHSTRATLVASAHLQMGGVDERWWIRPMAQNFPIDSWRGQETFVFQTPIRTLDRDALATPSYEIYSWNPYDQTGKYRADVVIEEFAFDETDKEFTISMRMESLSEEPTVGLWMGFVMPSGDFIAAGLHEVGEEPGMVSGYYDNETGHWVDIPVDLTLYPGEPGWAHFTWDRTHIGSPMQDERLNWFISTGNSEVAIWRNDEIGPLSLTTMDYYPALAWSGSGGPLYWFRNDTAPIEQESLGIHFQDETGDITMPPTLPLDEVEEDQFDIMYVEAKGWDVDTLQVILGIGDPARISVPTGYEALVYAVGLETEAGAFKAFYYNDGSQQDFYCAPDTLTFHPSPSDPNQVVWTQITGRLSHGAAGLGGDGGPTSGAIVFNVPHECVSAEPGLIRLDGLAAGTYLIERPAGIGALTEVHTVDSAEAPASALPSLLGVSSIEADPATPSKWYVAPLGLEGQDWNILGVVIAVLLAAGGAIAVWTKRHKLRNYLARVDQVAAIKDLSARETALGELRTLLRADLVAGQVSEGHYAVVMRHIDEAMKHVRVRSIEETFRELPFHIVSKLRSVLDDGVITQDEHEMVTDLIERAEIPSKDKQKVLARLERWQLVDEVAKA